MTQAEDAVCAGEAVGSCATKAPTGSVSDDGGLAATSPEFVGPKSSMADRTQTAGSTRSPITSSGGRGPPRGAAHPRAVVEAAEGPGPSVPLLSLRAVAAPHQLAFSGVEHQLSSALRAPKVGCDSVVGPTPVSSAVDQSGDRPGQAEGPGPGSPMKLGQVRPMTERPPGSA
jgi:hypothetical protein